MATKGVAPAETAVAGLPETVAQEPDPAPGLFDTAQVGTVDVDPVEAAANAVARHADAGTMPSDNERSA